MITPQVSLLYNFYITNIQSKTHKKGCYIWNKLRPIDQMCYALIESNGPNSDLVRAFFNKIYSVNNF
jgi:hypothetical protein